VITASLLFLFRPGEVAAPAGDAVPFRLGHVESRVGGRRVHADAATLADLDLATFVSFTFTTQRNAVRGEVIGLARSGDPFLCPVAATARRVTHLRLHNAPATALLCTVHTGNQSTSRIAASDSTAALRRAVTCAGPALGLTADEVSARSLRPSGAMALLCSEVDSDAIRLLGRWRSDEMSRHLTAQAQPLVRDFSRRMIRGGEHTLLPGPHVP